MLRQRIGNDISLRWAIYKKDGTPETFEGADVKVYVRHRGHNMLYLQEHSISGNVIDLQFTASEQKYTGKYDLVLHYKKPCANIESGFQVFTLDNIDAFELVGRTCDLECQILDTITLQGMVTGLTYSMLTDAEKQAIIDSFNTSFQRKLDKKVDKQFAHGLYPDVDKEKLFSIEAGAEVNVQANWTQINSTQDDFIKNKPSKLSQFADDVGFALAATQTTELAKKVDKVPGKQLSTEDYITAEKTKLSELKMPVLQEKSSQRFGLIPQLYTGYESYRLATGYQAIDLAIGTSSDSNINSHHGASGVLSIAMGAKAEAKGSMSIAIGHATKTISSYSISFGIANTNNSDNGVAIGVLNEISSWGTVAIGTQNTGIGSNVAIGQKNKPVGNNSYSIGSENVTQAIWSSAIGKKLYAKSYGEAVVGAYNTIYAHKGGQYSWHIEDRCFVVANGKSDTERSDALLIYKRGDALLPSCNVSYIKEDKHIITKEYLETAQEFMKLKPATAPANPTAGMIYFDNTDNKLKCFDGTTWQNLF